MAAHLGPTETAGKYTTGSYTDPLYHQVLLGEGNALPTNTNLYVEVTYYGSGTNARRVYSAIYTDPAHTQLLVVNGVEHYYWTQPLPAGQRFMLTDVGFWNYVDSNWDSLGRAGTGSGIFDDLYVQQLMPVLGDFNGDGVRNAADIDLLQAHMGDPAYDLNGDGVTNQADLTMLLNSLLGTVQGDANLDRKVNFSDFQVVLDNWQKSSIWATGDFNGDRITNFGDFQYLLDNWNKSVVTTAVPEPATLAPLAFGAAALVVRPRRKSTGR
jgi:hypothetical protein